MTFLFVTFGLMLIILLLVSYYVFSRKLMADAEFQVFGAKVRETKKIIDSIISEYSESLANIQRVRREYPATTIRSYRARVWESGHTSFKAFSPYESGNEDTLAESPLSVRLVKNWPDSLPEAVNEIEHAATEINKLLNLSPAEFKRDKTKVFWSDLQRVRIAIFTPHNLIRIGVNLMPSLESVKRDCVFIWEHDIQPLLKSIEMLKTEKKPLLKEQVIDALSTKECDITLKYFWLADSKRLEANEDWLMLANCLLSEILMLSSIKYFLESISAEHPVVPADIARLRRLGLYIPVETQV